MLDINSLAALAGLGEDPGDLNTDTHPYMRVMGARPQAGGGYAALVQRRTRTSRFTPGGLPQPPELMGVDADPRVPNPLQPISGEVADGQVVAGAVPAFHNPTMPAATGVASRETAAPGILQGASGGAAAGPDLDRLADLAGVRVPPVGDERAPGNGLLELTAVSLRPRPAAAPPRRT